MTEPGRLDRVPSLVEITRRGAFEASHRYWVPEWSAEENVRRFGPCTSPFGHGHNYTVEVTVRGPIDERMGMAINVVEVDRALATVIRRFDHRFINAEVAEFQAARLLPCVETLACSIRRAVSEELRAGGGDRRSGEGQGVGDSRAPTEVCVVAARVAEDETLAGVCEWRGPSPAGVALTPRPSPRGRGARGEGVPPVEEGRGLADVPQYPEAGMTPRTKGVAMGDAVASEVVSLVRSYTFSAAHRLHAAALTPEENRAIFGKCNNPYGHGHTYQLDVTITGAPDPRTGMVVDLAQLDAAVQDHVLGRVDHRHLNLEVPPFDVVNPTSENVARAIWEWLAPVCPGPLAAITLHETPRSRFTLRQEEA
ncbi:MAG: 6-carboxytetrahydropterin synthase [Chloroflexi bacterium]|nr:6-carboxytetrahydropterin synthase [Chloroflexota bacterium]